MPAVGGAAQPIDSAGMSPTVRRFLDPTLVGLAVLLAVIGVFTFVHHLQTDPLVDIHAYYQAAQRLNAGLPLYAAQGDVNGPLYYFYPPLLAIVFRPLALLPFEAAAIVWEIAMAAALGATLWLLGLRRPADVDRRRPPRRTDRLVADRRPGPGPGDPPADPGQSRRGRRRGPDQALPGPRRAVLGRAPRLAQPRAVRRLERGARRRPARPRAERLDRLPGHDQRRASSARSTTCRPYAISPFLWAGLVDRRVPRHAAPGARPAPAGRSAITYSVLATPRLLEYVLMSLLAALREPGQHPRTEHQAK